MIKHNLTKYVFPICGTAYRKKVHEVLKNNHEFVDLKLLDWHMLDFQETPLITNGDSLELGGPWPPP
jgi:hypothetical protein